MPAKVWADSSLPNYLAKKCRINVRINTKPSVCAVSQAYLSNYLIILLNMGTRVCEADFVHTHLKARKEKRPLKSALPQTTPR